MRQGAKIGMLGAAALLTAAFTVHASTRYWSPTALASDGKSSWTNANNWLDDSGSTGTGQLAVLGDGIGMTIIFK